MGWFDEFLMDADEMMNFDENLIGSRQTQVTTLARAAGLSTSF
jgi:hypothetical protein